MPASMSQRLGSLIHSFFGYQSRCWNNTASRTQLLVSALSSTLQRGLCLVFDVVSDRAQKARVRRAAAPPSPRVRRADAIHSWERTQLHSASASRVKRFSRTSCRRASAPCQPHRLRTCRDCCGSSLLLLLLLLLCGGQREPRSAVDGAYVLRPRDH